MFAYLLMLQDGKKKVNDNASSSDVPSVPVQLCLKLVEGSQGLGSGVWGLVGVYVCVGSFHVLRHPSP